MKRKVVIITGTPGTGKTKVAGLIAKKIKAKYIDINKVIDENKLSSGFDKKLKTKLVDVDRLVLVLIRIIKKSRENLVIDGHLSHYIPAKHVYRCVVITCDLKVLKRRLEGRGYSKVKIKENMDSEIFSICLLEAINKKHKVRIVNTTKGVKRLDVKGLLR